MLILAEKSKAYYYEDVAAAVLVNDMLDCFPVVVWAADNNFHAYVRQVGDRPRTFCAEGDKLVDEETVQVYGKWIMGMTPSNPLALALWRRMVAQMYASVRSEVTAEPAAAWRNFRAARDDLFRFHPQSPLDEAQRASFTNLAYYPYDPVWRVVGRVDQTAPRQTFRVDLGQDGGFAYTRIAYIHFAIDGEAARLSLFWVEGYGGGLFLPFKDVTSGHRTYGGGRYLYDTIKGADLGVGTEEIVLDFNFAYNPSCAYNARWVCPLAPEENKLPFAVTVGELAFA